MTASIDVSMSRYIFVAGLHRSGTSLIARSIAAHPAISAISGSPAPEDEGVYLQGAIPHTALHGRPGAFAHDPAQHLTEDSRFNTLDTARHIAAQWNPWYDARAPWRLEKSPVNLLRARLYQQLFPSCVFVFVTRHPLAVTMATRKWSDRSAQELMDHWDAAHALLLADLPYLHRWVVLRYEDFAASPQDQLDRVTALAELPPVAVTTEAVASTNDAYFEEAPAGLRSAVAREFDYSLDAVCTGTGPMPRPAGHHVYRSVMEEIV